MGDDNRQLPPIHPGEILEKEFLEPAGLSQNKVAMVIRVPARRINEIVQEKRGITADTALRLGRFFEVSPQFWLNLQARYDLKTAEREKGEEIASDVKPLAELE